VNRALLWKLLAVLAVTVALVVPLQMTEQLIGERRSLRDRVMSDIAQSGTGAQRMEGIVILVPCIDRYEETETLHDGRKIVRQHTRNCDVRVLPKELRVTADLTTDFRYRGIHRAMVYQIAADIEAAFELPPQPTPNGMRRTWGEPRLLVGIGDQRGIRSTPVASWNGAALQFQAGTGNAVWTKGVHVAVPIDPGAGGSGRLALKLGLAGMDRLDVVPAADEVEFTLRSPWPHPSFVGRFLPDTRTVSDAGFEAVWRTTGLATNIRDAFQRCGTGQCDEYAASAFGVSLMPGVDVYQQSYRAVHYGFLFVVLTFALFFLYEVLAGLKVHPIQYGLVGIALTAFYLLLIALAEHIDFALAYLAATSACVLLIGVYVRYVLGSLGRAAGMAALMSALYACLYMVLGSEDYALLMGAMLLFAVLAAFMLATRKLDWYALPIRVNGASRDIGIAT
jgi:inner membrane protein